MSKQALFTMKLESDLHTAFKAEAEAAHRSASQVVRDMMRDFIKQQREARDYEAFVQHKVEAARGSLAAGQGIAHEDVEAAMAARRQLLGER
ncbi:antitoxin of toxin-antitoxin stability system [Asticcacaulis sp. EMRT-3]|uniref:antitoxin of toxin-antitoxin stability system n=1 Tax=Asticcacaulis sp. EMRT-3 TaxID=3040349 RepID=UPI0024AF7484|nr:antitoxin of toxin-antitoxin stability system [Asticcacaulis sp. EMRT-3]MDI7776288.1 antitoxin of toxin-antitoxin stability system [Asticcacaulis sp. EMRT-3]